MKPNTYEKQSCDQECRPMLSTSEILFIIFTKHEHRLLNFLNNKIKIYENKK